jgi:tRNA/rRNA methyltransferase
MKSLDNFRIVLVSPLYGGNIGSVCRAMMNAGMTDLAIVNPRETTDWDMAYRMAYRAREVLEKRNEYSSIEEAVAGCSFVAGTSARTGLYRDHAYSAKDIAPLALESADKGNKVAIVFGPEDAGLNNDDLKVCTHILQIPSHEMYTSLNLSHAVMVAVYEIFAQSETFEHSSESSPECTIELRERMFDAWEQVMDRTGFAEPHKLEHMMLGLRRILSRGQLTECDARILIGLARQTLWVTEKWENAGSPKE